MTHVISKQPTDKAELLRLHRKISKLHELEQVICWSMCECVTLCSEVIVKPACSESSSSQVSSDLGIFAALITF